MAIIGAINYSMFGDTSSPMLDGLFASVGYFTFQDDPDGFSDDQVLKALNVSTNGSWPVTRLVLPADAVICGVARRVYLASLPSSNNATPIIIEFRSAANATLASLNVQSNGNLRVAINGGDEFETTVPVITAGGWYHVEMIYDTTKTNLADFEVRVNGVTRLMEVDATAPDTATGQLVNRGVNDGTTICPTFYDKDFVWYDGTGTENNDFLGQVAVFWRKPTSTIAAGGWTSNAGADADETISKPRYANVLTASGAIASGNQVRIDSTYYNWTSGSVDAGSPAGTSANPWLVALGADDAESMANMYAAIGASGTPGVTYSTGLTAHTTVTPFGLTDTTIAVIPTDGVTINMTFSETGTNTAWLSSTAFRDQVHDAIRMSADYTPAVAASGMVTFSGLPAINDTVTIGAEVYTFKAARGGSGEVTIGADATETGDNFVTALGLDSAIVTGVNAAGVVTVTAISAGAAGNSITLAESAANTAVSGANLTGGVDTVYPTPFQVRLEPLPDDVTRIRGIIPIVRAAKIDGGDGNIQVSFGISDASYDDGPDSPITTAFTYWGNPTDPFVSELNPDTAAEWTPGEFNVGARMKIARTV